MKKDKSLNDEQNLAVYSRGSSILVSAPAGSGKTKILVNRMMSLIEDDHVSVDSLLVLTFTKAAALEMKQRLVESLNKRIHVVDDSLKVHLEKQKILLPGKTFYGSIRHGLPHETKRSGARKHLHFKYDGTDYGVHYRLPLCGYE